MTEQDTIKTIEIGKGDEYMNEAIDVLRYNYLGEAYDKEWALKDDAFGDGINEGVE